MLFAEVVFIGKEGSVYDVAEKDAYEEILERVSKVSWKDLWNKLAVNVTRSLYVDVKSVGKARENRTEIYYPVYTLPYDVRDHKGNLLYPKGYSFNPLDYVKIPYVLVFVDFTSRKELEWLTNSGFLSQWNALIIAVRGNIFDAQAITNRVVYGANEYLISNLHVKRTPSYLYQKDNYWVLTEVGVHDFYNPKGKKRRINK